MDRIEFGDENNASINFTYDLNQDLKIWGYNVFGDGFSVKLTNKEATNLFEFLYKYVAPDQNDMICRNKIGMIKFLRAVANDVQKIRNENPTYQQLGLKEAKDIVDAYVLNHQALAQPFYKTGLDAINNLKTALFQGNLKEVVYFTKLITVSITKLESPYKEMLEKKFNEVI